MSDSESDRKRLEGYKQFNGTLSEVRALGKGTRATVYVEHPNSFCLFRFLDSGKECKWTRNGASTNVAVKVINRQPDDSQESILKEVEILKGLSHPNLIKVFGWRKFDPYIYIATELARGDTLFAKLKHLQSLEEANAATIIYQILDGVEYLHNNGIIHRDLKPDNILFKNKDRGKSDEDSESDSGSNPKNGLDLNAERIVIADFGFAVHMDENKLAEDDYDWTGFLRYAAPEIFERARHGASVDIWSIGVLCYEILSGENFQRERRNKFQVKDRIWRKIPELARDLIRKCLYMNPKKRPTATEAKHNEWIRSNTGKTVAGVRKGFAPLPNWKFAIKKLKVNRREGGDRFAGVVDISMARTALHKVQSDRSGVNDDQRTSQKRDTSPSTILAQKKARTTSSSRRSSLGAASGSGGKHNVGGAGVEAVSAKARRHKESSAARGQKR